MSYDIGDTKKLQLTEIRDEDGKPVDPTTVQLSVLRPSAVVDVHTGGELNHEETGSFAFNLPLDEAGVWQYRWVTSGGVDLAEPGILVVGPDPITATFSDPNFTVADVWARSAFLQRQYPRGPAEAGLEFVVAAVAPLVGSLTGRSIAGVEGTPVPAALVPIELQAIAMKADGFSKATSSSKSRRSSIGRGNLASFSAGSYSESYFGPSQAMEAKRLDTDPVLADLLWALCTPEKQLYWLAIWDPANFAGGEGQLVSFEWGNRPNYSPRPGWPWRC